MLNELGYALPLQLTLLLTVLVGRVANLASFGDALDTTLAQDSFAVTCALILADHLGTQILDGVVIDRVWSTSRSANVTTHLDANIAVKFLELLIRKIREQLLHVSELNTISVLLQEAQDIGLTA